jgi:hypothetical protein
MRMQNQVTVTAILCLGEGERFPEARKQLFVSCLLASFLLGEEGSS